MRWKVPRPQPETIKTGGPPDTATVVIGIDGLPGSWDAFRWACRETRRLGGRVVVVLIRPATEAGLAAMLCEAGNLDLTVVEACGDAVAELLRITRELHADLLVVGGSARARHRLTGAIGPRLAARCRESVVAVVPPSMPGGEN
jgi:nucleotide-binding universal stress UspA family protein